MVESVHGTARHGTARHGMAWHGMARHGTARHGTAWHGMARHGTARHGTARHGTARHGTARHGTAWHGMARHGTARHGMEREEVYEYSLQWANHRYLLHSPRGGVIREPLQLQHQMLRQSIPLLSCSAIFRDRAVLLQEVRLHGVLQSELSCAHLVAASLRAAACSQNLRLKVASKRHRKAFVTFNVNGDVEAALDFRSVVWYVQALDVLHGAHLHRSGRQLCSLLR
jgi:hypothetical protein